MSFKDVMTTLEVMEGLQESIPPKWDTLEEDSNVYQFLKIVEAEFNLFQEACKDVMNAHFLGVPSESPIAEPVDIVIDTISQPIHRPGGMTLKGKVDPDDLEFKGGIGELLGMRIGFLRDEPENLYRSRLLNSVDSLQGGGTIPAIKDMMKLATRRLSNKGAHPEGYEPDIVEIPFTGARWGDDSNPPSGTSGNWYYWSDDENMPDENNWMAEITFTKWASDDEDTDSLFFWCKFLLDSLMEDVGELFVKLDPVTMLGSDVGIQANITILQPIGTFNNMVDGKFPFAKDITNVVFDETKQFAVCTLFDEVVHYDTGGTTYITITKETIGDPLLNFVVDDTDYVYVGDRIMFPYLAFLLETAANPGYTVTAEYWNGAWTAVPEFNDLETSGLSLNGAMLLERITAGGFEQASTYYPSYTESGWKSLKEESNIFDIGEIHLNDFIAFGDVIDKFGNVRIEMGTLKNTIANLGEKLSFTFEYWNGAWVSLTVTDGTNEFEQSGIISFTKPGDWVTNDLGDGSAFHIKARVDVEPTATVSGDLSFFNVAVDSIHEDWTAANLAVIAPGSPPTTDSLYWVRLLLSVDQTTEAIIKTLFPVSQPTGGTYQLQGNLIIGATFKPTGFKVLVGDVLPSDFVTSYLSHYRFIYALIQNDFSYGDPIISLSYFGSSPTIKYDEKHEQDGQDYLSNRHWFLNYAEDEPRTQQLKLLTIQNEEKYWMSINDVDVDNEEGCALLKTLKPLTVSGKDVEKLYADDPGNGVMANAQFIEHIFTQDGSIQLDFGLISALTDLDIGDVDVSFSTFPDIPAKESLKVSLEEIDADSALGALLAIKITPDRSIIDSWKPVIVTDETYVQMIYHVEDVPVDPSEYLAGLILTFRDPELDDPTVIKWSMVYAFAGNPTYMSGVPGYAMVDITSGFVHGVTTKFSRNIKGDYFAATGEDPSIYPDGSPEIIEISPLFLAVAKDSSEKVSIHLSDFRIADIETLSDFDFWTQPLNMAFLNNLLQKIKSGGVQAALKFQAI